MWDRGSMERTRTSVAIKVVAAAIFLLGCGQTHKATPRPVAATGGDAGAAGGGAKATGGSANGTGGGANAVGGDANAGGGSKMAEPFGGAATWDPQACHVTPVPEPADAT